MANTQVRIRSPKGNVGVTDVVDAGELSAYSQGALSGFGATSAASFTIQIGGSSSVQDVAVGKNPAGESELFVGTSGTTIPFIIGGAPGTPGQSRTDALVLYKDPFTTSVVNNGLDVTDYAVVAGTPATTGTQVPPSMATIRSTIPTGSLKFVAVIGYVTIAQGASSVTTGNYFRNRSLLSTQTVANATEMSLITPVEGMKVYRDDLDLSLVYNGSRWKWATPRDFGLTQHGTNFLLTASYTDRITPSAITTLGGEVEIEVMLATYNSASGADRQINVNIVCDGSTIKNVSGLSSMLNGTAPSADFTSFVFRHTPTAASHTYKIQASCSAASACYMTSDSYVILKEIS